jgi:PIN domain nuclease of toxin-antitoxin system
MTLTELQPDDLIIGHSLNFNRDPFDRLVVAAALRLALPLITADGDITDAKPFEISWK